jgi:hypothetical protein
VFALQTVKHEGWTGTALLGYERFVSALSVSEYFLGRYGCNRRFLLTRAMLVDFAITLPTGLAGWLRTNEDEFAGLCARSEIRLRLSGAVSYVKRGNDIDLGTSRKVAPASRMCFLTVSNILYVSLTCLT